ncbi:MAG TPA: BamA/TamA family outer membrane protein, partial [Kofleriaceae bacterium]|nr:BamA/TamA family outer membrane protein [Kofleriaceae bacterium]
ADARPAYTMLRNSNEVRLGGRARLALRRPDLIVPLLEPLAEAWYDFVQLETYEARGPGLGLGLGRPFFDRALQVGAGWKARWVEFTEVHPGITAETAERIGLVEPYRVGYFDQVVAYDRRDQLLDPHRGFFAQARAEEAGRFSGSRFDYVKLTGEMRGYVSPASRWVLAARVSLGSVLSGDLPITQRYFSGGASSHRGFGQRELAPSVVDPEAGEAPLGGAAQLESSFEVRVDIRQLWGSWLGIVTFLDGGDVTTSFGDLDPSNLHWAPGLGLRYDTIVGPIRFDVGYRVNRTGPGNPQQGNHLAFHLSLGEAF